MSPDTSKLDSELTSKAFNSCYMHKVHVRHGPVLYTHINILRLYVSTLRPS